LELAEPAIIHRCAGPASAGYSHLLQSIRTCVGAGPARRLSISCFLIGRSVAFQATASGAIKSKIQIAIMIMITITILIMKRIEVRP
jgi:hypothetical protein